MHFEQSGLELFQVALVCVTPVMNSNLTWELKKKKRERERERERENGSSAVSIMSSHKLIRKGQGE